MPLLDRPMLFSDRPTVIDNEDSEGSDESSDDVVEVLGDGGGHTVHGLELEPDSEEVIKTSNMVALLATGEEGGGIYSEVFKNAAIQLNELQNRGHDISDLGAFSENINAAYIGIDEAEFDEPESESEDSSDDDSEEEEESSEDYESSEDSDVNDDEEDDGYGFNDDDSEED